MNKATKKTETEWKSELPADAFAVCRLKGTEAPFSGEYYTEKRPGIYHCRCCDAPLFTSVTKYDSGSGWPSFYAPASAGAITEHEDGTLGMRRTELTCSACDSHLGHVFTDGPPPTSLRYCINSLSLRFVPSA